jgi:outer membrane protein OmpA-like peptidoglycan-associated protein
MKNAFTVSTGSAWLTCFLMLGCSHDAQPRTPEAEPVMAPASSEGSEQRSTVAPQPNNYIVVEESVRTTCNLPNDEEKAPKFDYDQAELRPRGTGILDGVARCLTDGPMKDQSITIVGHADPRGSDDYNQQLGRKRAEAARDYLTGRGLSSDRIRVESRGESGATGTDEGGWATDRRVEVKRASAQP